MFLSNVKGRMFISGISVKYGLLCHCVNEMHYSHSFIVCSFPLSNTMPIILV